MSDSEDTSGSANEEPPMTSAEDTTDTTDTEGGGTTSPPMSSGSHTSRMGGGSGSAPTSGPLSPAGSVMRAPDLGSSRRRRPRYAGEDDGEGDEEEMIDGPVDDILDVLTMDHLEDDENPDEEEGFFDDAETEGSGSVSSMRRRSKTRKNQVILSSDAESSPESEGELDMPINALEIPPEYWQVQRLIKYIKAGNPTATIISMSTLRDFNLKDPYIQKAIQDSAGIDVLVNILETDENRCKIASLLILREITTNPEISRIVFNMKGVETLVRNLCDPAKELKLLSAEVLANISKIRKARRAMRKGDGINRLVDMLDLEIPNNHLWHNMEGDAIDFDVPRCGSLCLWSLARSTKNKDAIRRAGAIPLLANLLKSKHVSVIIPVVGILHECSSEASFRLAIRTEGLLVDFVDGLKSNNFQLVQFCASAIYMCAEDPESRQIVYNLGAMDPLINIMSDENLRQNKPLLAAATGAIWKCGSSIAKEKKYLESPFNLVEILVQLLDDEPEYILANVAGAIEQVIKTDPVNAALIKKAGAIPYLIGLLTINNPLILVNATKAVGQLARDADARREMDSQDGFRLVWSLLKHPTPSVQASAAWAISPYVESFPESGDVVRNFVGGLEALVNLLTSEDIQVQAAVAQAVAVIALNVENLAIMSDHGVCQHLARLSPTRNDFLRRNVAEAIAECCKWKSNAEDFGKRKAVSPICAYLQSEDPLVHRAAARALAALSKDPRNCITMHQCGVVDFLINMIGSPDMILANAAADAIYNIRMLAMAVERVRLR